MKYVRAILAGTSQVEQDGACLLKGLSHPACAPFALADVAGITLVAFDTSVLAETGGAILTRIRRRGGWAKPATVLRPSAARPAGGEIGTDCEVPPHVPFPAGGGVAAAGWAAPRTGHRVAMR